MTHSDTYDKVKTFIEDELLDGDSISDETRLFGDGLIDSMNLVQLLGFLEQQFAVKVPTASVNIRNLDTVSSITDLVDGLRT